ncbi:hypothetical protein B0H19DRAFT_1231778 [Mycena capillaripes]|nr:hypothetical protein B0H19DRAFT_1231778 [Mycena capillaripes]
MLVDSPMAQSVFAPPYTDYSSQDLNDIFHTELFSLPSSAASSSSQSSGSRESTPHLLTPPQQPPASSFPEIAGDSPTPSFFNFLDEDVKALDPLAMLSSAPYDFFGVGAGGFSSGGGGGASMGMDTTTMSSAEMSAMLGIDPQLVGSPAPVNSFSDFESSSSSSQHDSTSPSATSPEDTTTTIAPVKVGGHGKARKGTVVSGGIKKSSSSSSVSTTAYSTSAVKENTAANSFMPTTTFKPQPRGGSKGGDDEDDDDDLPADWRPPPEVFQKMSSKEKRQLRNKISARNFRVRRKEYISTLEDNIAERDRLLSAIRSELGSTQSENLALRQEIAALKRTLLDNRGPAPVLPPPAPLSSPSLSALASPSLSSPSSSSATKKEDLPAAHTLKDVSTSNTNSRFWAGAHGVGMGGYTSVHTAHRIELFGAGAWSASPFAESTNAPQQQENLNPALNNSPVTEVLRSGLGLGAATGAPAQDPAWGDVNPFTVRSLDAYRMHLWGRMAAQYRHNKEHGAAAGSPTSSSSTSPTSSPTAGNSPPHAHAHPHSHTHTHTHPSPFSGAASPFSNGSPTSNGASAFAPSPFFNPAAAAKPHAGLSGLAGGMRPKYFANPTLGSSASPSGSNAGANGLAAALAGLSLSGKGGAQAQMQARQREVQREVQREKDSQSQRERETAMYAAMASQTLLKRLGGAFWEAFSGAEGKAGSSSSLPSSSASSSSASSSGGAGARGWDAEKVRKVLEGRAVVRVVDVEPPASPKIAPVSPRLTAAAATPSVQQQQEKKCPSVHLAECLEESMRGLTLAGKK